MKIRLITFLIALASIPMDAHSCWISASQQISVQDDTLTVIQSANFCLGSGPTCPFIYNYDINIESNVITLNAYYNIAAAWPGASCTDQDTIREEVPYGQYTIVFNSWITDFDSTYVVERDTTTSITLSLGSLSLDKEFAYPNPSSGNLEFHSSSGLTGKVLDIYDTRGSLVYSTHLVKNKSIQVNNLNPGVYFLYLSSNGIIERRQRIIFN